MDFKASATFLLGKIPGSPINPDNSILSGGRGKIGFGILSVYRKYALKDGEYEIKDVYFTIGGNALEFMQNIEVFSVIASSTMETFSGVFRKHGIDKTLIKSPIASNIFFFEANPQRISLETSSAVRVEPTLAHEDVSSLLDDLKTFKKNANSFESTAFKKIRNRWYRIPRSPVNRYLNISGVSALLPTRSKMFKNTTVFLGLENFVELRIFLEKYYKYLDLDFENSSFVVSQMNIKGNEIVNKEHYLLFINELTNEYYIVEIENENVTLGIPRKTLFEYNIRLRILGEFNIITEVFGFLGLQKLEELLLTAASSVSSAMLYADKLSNMKSLVAKYK